MVRLGRKGMSPLIATVLLMAFAVALGGMIMNWGDRMVNDPLQMCQDVDLNVRTFCSSDNGIRINVENEGDVPIATLTVSVSGAGGEFSTDVGNSGLGADQRLQSTIPIAVKQGDTVTLFSKLGQDQDIKLCPQPIVQVSPLPNC